MSPANPERRARAFTAGWVSLAVPVFLAVQVLVVHAAAGLDRPPQPPPVAGFPAAAGDWKVLHQDPIDLEMATLKADVLVSQTYLERPTNSSASLMVAWYKTQRDGATQPHSPRVCLPGAGWTPEIADYTTVNTATGPITVNRYIVVKGPQRAVVLYWYQTPWRVIASEWAEKFWVAADALRSKRTDAALVRIVVWSTSGRDNAATAVATGFARDVYPALRNYLPQ